ncbi:uncharacterized protein NEMAJ01_2062 [Nematocida major]|uniref:uncharacterized protein n=1 Tax=Nematocida major TaxID=1912982 RepID=UPI002008E58B|nr:uncharacterized protein NEMAJ01_2062 [Nematocida major]KAH9387166.1 hypothetical protein NEMAJ01_2062 [Nematocida major]
MQEGVYYSTIEEDRMLSAEELDRERKRNQIYEYLCHMQEAREWIENIIQEKIPDEFEHALKDGVYLARLVQLFRPELASKIFRNPVLQYRHTDNINKFFEFSKRVGMPAVFMFDLVDLYEGKNIPKVIYCIHALGHFLSRKNIAIKPSNLVGRAIFTEDQITKKEKEIEESGVVLPSFSGIAGSVGATVDSKVESEQSVQSPLEIGVSCMDDGLLEGAEETEEATNSEILDSFDAKGELADELNEKGEASGAADVETCTRDEAALTEENLQDAQVIQAYFRMLLARRIVQELKGEASTSIFTIRKMLRFFKGDEEREETVVDELNKILVQLFAENADLESKVAAVENRISLMLKNKIQKKASLPAEKRTYMKYMALQKLFAKLQDDPSIATQLIMGLRQREAEAFCRTKLLGFFGHAQTPREEYTYMRVVETLVHASPVLAAHKKSERMAEAGSEEWITSAGSNRDKVLGGIALHALVVAQGLTERMEAVRKMIEGGAQAQEVIAFVVESAHTLPHVIRFYARFLVMALNKQSVQRDEGESAKDLSAENERMQVEVFLSIWEVFFAPVVIDVPAGERRAVLMDACKKVAEIADREKWMGLTQAQFSKAEKLHQVESLSEYYTMQYIAARQPNHMLGLSGEEINELLSKILCSTNLPEDFKNLAKECVPFPFKLVFVVPGGVLPYFQENAGAVEKRLCKWAVVKALSNTAGKSMSEVVQSKACDMACGSVYALHSEEEVEKCREKAQKYAGRLFELGMVQDAGECKEILKMIGTDLANRHRASLARKREIRATEKAIASLEKAREGVERRKAECRVYLENVSAKILEKGGEFKCSAKKLLQEGIILRMYNWQSSQLDSIMLSFKKSPLGEVVVSVFVIGIQSASEKLALDEVLLRESEGETEMQMESLGAVFSIPKLILLINKKMRV